jgi:hypothetical protein
MIVGMDSITGGNLKAIHAGDERFDLGLDLATQMGSMAGYLDRM